MFYTPCTRCASMRTLLAEFTEKIGDLYDTGQSNCNLDPLPVPQCNHCGSRGKVLTPEAIEFREEIIGEIAAAYGKAVPA